MIADTINLLKGNYSATLHIHSNGGDAKVEVSLAVTTQPTSVPTAVPMLTVTPLRLNADTDCYPDYLGWLCSVSLGNSGQGSLNWAAASSGVAGITFNPPGGSLAPGRTVQVSIHVPQTTCTASAILTFSAGAKPVTVSWTCTQSAPVPTPTPPSASTSAVAPAHFNTDVGCSLHYSRQINSVSPCNSQKWLLETSGFTNVMNLVNFIASIISLIIGALAVLLASVVRLRSGRRGQ